MKTALALGMAAGLAVGGPFAAEPIITTFAGGGTNGLGDGGPATSAQLDTPSSIAVDAWGNVYIAEGADSYTSCRVRKVTPAGVITTYAGNGTRDQLGENVPATSVSVCPKALAVDSAGNLYIAEQTRVRRVGTNGLISTIVGTGDFGYSGDGGPAKQAQVANVYDVAVDGIGQLYLVDGLNYRVRRVDLQGVIRTVAGNGNYQTSGDDGLATLAGMSPRAITVDAFGNLFITDSSSRTIRRVSTAGVITRVAGNGPFRSDPLAINSDMYYPWGLTADPSGNVYVANESEIVHLITPQGILKVIAGNYNDSTFSPYGAWWGFGGDGGPATLALLNTPSDVALDAQGNVYIADTKNGRVRKVTPPTAPSVPSGVGAFRPVTTYPAGTYDGALAVGDFNGDHRNDVAIATGSWGSSEPDPVNDDRILLFLQQPDGRLAPPLRFQFTPQCSTSHLRSADLNGDGMSDLVCGTSGGVGVIFGGRDGLHTGPVLAGDPNAAVPQDIIIGDVDLDGRPDIVAWMAGRSEGGSYPTDLIALTVFYGDGRGGAARRRFLPQSIMAGTLAWGDINRDGRADLVSTWADANNDSGLAVFYHDGVDSFRAPVIKRIGEAGFGRGIASGDFDGDGRIEFIVSRAQNAPQAKLARFRVTDNNDLVLAGVERTFDIPSDLVGADMDNDGRDDLLIQHAGWSSIGYQHQIGAPAPSMLDTEVKYQVRTRNDVYGGLAAADINGDGCRDAILSDNVFGLQVLYATSCFATLAPSRPLLPPKLSSLTAGGSPTTVERAQTSTNFVDVVKTYATTSTREIIEGARTVVVRIVEPRKVAAFSVVLFAMIGLVLATSRRARLFARRR